MVDGNGAKLMTEVYAKYNIVPLPAATPGADGWLVPQGSEEHRETSRA